MNKQHDNIISLPGDDLPMTDDLELQRIPSFTLPDENGEMFDDGMLRGLRWVLYFFPNAGTPGCTQEALDFTS
ncbi:MAG: redoxin domain-containing protein, partial [Candidatus Methanomethylophilaceae archaeon]